MNQYIDSLIKENLNTNVNESVDQDDEPQSLGGSILLMLGK